MNEILVLNNLWGIYMPLKKKKQKKRFACFHQNFGMKKIWRFSLDTFWAHLLSVAKNKYFTFSLKYEAKYVGTGVYFLFIFMNNVPSNLLMTLVGPKKPITKDVECVTSITFLF